jgi:tripartite-type tricarboxylate transporter receptor subunit TctC
VALWYGIVGPKNLPAAIVERLNGEINKLLTRKDAPAKLEADGTYVAGGSANEFGTAIEREIVLWRGVVGKLGIKVE